MRLSRWEPWVGEILAGSPSISGVTTFKDAGWTERRYGHVITLRTGATIALQWVRTSPPGGDDHTTDEAQITGEPPARIELPELPTDGRVRLADVEAHLVALIANGRNDEVAALERHSTRADPGPRPCRVGVRMQSGANVHGLFLHVAPAGREVTSGDEFEQREEV